MAELSRLGRYELRRVLGKGAMGVVYEGFDPTLNRRVAVKTILRSVALDADTQRDYSARFVREAQAVGRLNHPHIVQVHDFGEQDEVAYIVMEFIEGRELRAFFDEGVKFETAEAVRIMRELLDALEFAHEKNVIHRDVKPANVMLDAQRQVKLADFGVARIQDSERSQGGTMVGTPAFMSPEQIQGWKIDRRTDIFSAGMILYQLLAGEQPFKGKGEWTIAKQIVQDDPPLPSSIALNVSPVFDDVVNKAIAKNPALRFASARDFSAALRAALAGERLAAPVETQKQKSGAESRAGDAEVEFWRSIQGSNDPAEFQVYLKEFPQGIYAELARIKMAKLPRVATGRAGANLERTQEQERKQFEDALRREDEDLAKLAEEKAKLETVLAQREAEYRKREAEEEAKWAADAKARLESEAKREAEARARVEAEARARLEVIEKAKKEAQAELAKKEAEYLKREADARAKAAAEAKAWAEADAKAKKEAEARAKAEAEARAKAKAEADARAKKYAEELAKRDAELAKHEADLREREAAAPQRKAPLVRIFIAFVVVVAGAFGAHYWTISSDEARVAALTAALETATKATQELNLARQRQEELLKQVEVARLAEDDARAKGDQAKLKELQEQTKRAEAEQQKQAELVKQREAEAEKRADALKQQQALQTDAKKKSADEARAAAEKTAAEKIAAEKAAAEKAAQEKAAQDAAQQAKAAEQAAAQKAATEKLAVEKASAEKVAAGKAAVASVSTVSALKQFMARHSRSKLVAQEPPKWTVPTGEVVYVNDGSCPDGEIKELTGGSATIRRTTKCVKLSQ